MKNLNSKFHHDLLKTYQKAAKLGYRPTKFLQMLDEHGGVGTAQILLSDDSYIQEGLIKLWDLGCLELSVEAIVLKSEYKALFTPEELKESKRRLDNLNS